MDGEHLFLGVCLQKINFDRLTQLLIKAQVY